jgi:hypothetical protein
MMLVLEKDEHTVIAPQGHFLRMTTSSFRERAPGAWQAHGVVEYWSGGAKGKMNVEWRIKRKR